MRTRWVAVLLATGLLAAGCGSNGSNGSSGGGGSSPTATSPATSAPSTAATGSPASADVCADAAALEASINRLLTITVGGGTASELQNDLTEVGSSITTLLHTAQAEWQDEIVALQTSLTTLQTAVQQLASNPGTATVAAVRTALVGVSTAAQNLFAAVSANCPSLSPSPTS
jgi:hypothetical protein